MSFFLLFLLLSFFFLFIFVLLELGISVFTPHFYARYINFCHYFNSFFIGESFFFFFLFGSSITGRPLWNRIDIFVVFFKPTVCQCACECELRFFLFGSSCFMRKSLRESRKNLFFLCLVTGWNIEKRKSDDGDDKEE